MALSTLFGYFSFQKHFSFPIYIIASFDGTLSIQYHELKLINIVPSYTMPWLNINNLTKYCVMIVHG